MFVRYPCWMTTRLLIDCGADVDALDSNKNTPLHVLAGQIPSSNVLKIIDLLCNAGAHLDYVNRNEKTPVESVPLYHPMMIENLKKKMDISRLKCLCARVIRQQNFSIENILSTSLVSFVQIH